jgi:hypothetical protein
MSLFKNIVDEYLLNELKQDRYDDIKKAINNVLRVRIGYDDKKGGKGKNERYILPVAFGLDKNGKKVIRAYQTAGSSKRGLTNPPNPRKEPNWKFFFVDNIYSWVNGKRSFKEYKDTLISKGLNLHGDKHMTTLYAITPFANDTVQVAKDTNPMAPTPVTKADVSPTQAVQNPNTTDTTKFEPAGISRGKTIDIQPSTNYTNNKLDAPETAPVTKSQIVEPNQPEAKSDDMEKMTAKVTEPIEKSDIDTNANNDEKEKIKTDFNDMMNRMDNLYNNDEEKQ